jgi:hypothetical protein
MKGVADTITAAATAPVTFFLKDIVVILQLDRFSGPDYIAWETFLRSDVPKSLTIFSPSILIYRSINYLCPITFREQPITFSTDTLSSLSIKPSLICSFLLSLGAFGVCAEHVNDSPSRHPVALSILHDTVAGDILIRASVWLRCLKDSLDVESIQDVLVPNTGKRDLRVSSPPFPLGLHFTRYFVSVFSHEIDPFRWG